MQWEVCAQSELSLVITIFSKRMIATFPRIKSKFTLIMQFLLGFLISSAVSLPSLTSSLKEAEDPPSSTCQSIYQQCGGIGWTGSTLCCASVCSVVNEYYHQCLPDPQATFSSSTSTSTPSASTSQNPTSATTSLTSASPKPSTTGLSGIQIGKATENYLPPYSIKVDGKVLDTSLTIDANWRWVHSKEGYQNCYDQKAWNKKLCPDSQTCAENCVIEGVSKSQWPSTYGIDVGSSASVAENSENLASFSTEASNDKVTLKLVTGSNIGSRLFLMDEDKSNYYGFSLLNREFVFTVDASSLGCGLNGALYLVSMDLNNSKSKNDPSLAGPAYGVGYGDAQ